MTGVADRASWRRHFADILVSGDDREVDAATDAAVTALGRGADWGMANGAGKAAARQFRSATGGVRFAEPPRPPVNATWPRELAVRLFATPARWGWRAAEPPAPGPPPPPFQPRPAWVEPPRPDTSALRGKRSSAVSKLIWTAAVAVLVVVAYLAFQSTIEHQIRHAGSSARDVYNIAVIVVAVVLALAVLRALGGVRRAAADIRRFEQPYETLRSAERERHAQALREWEGAARRHAAEATEATREAQRRAGGPQWFPVRPAAEPTRVDVFGGDPRRHGWASLLVTLGSSVLAAGRRLTVLDFTGQDVGGGLLHVAAANGVRTRQEDLGPGTQLNLLAGVSRRDVAECLAYALTSRPERGDQRQERALITDTLHRVVGCLEEPITFARLAAGVRVLRQGGGGELLNPAEVGGLATHIGDIDQNEWTARQLRFVVSQLETLHGTASAPAHGRPLWTNDPVSVLTSGGGRDDRKDLVDRFVVQLALLAMAGGHRPGDWLVVSGADHLGAPTLEMLSDHARQAGVQLLLMIDQPQGELERTAGTGGVVCVMKMYNHRDASIAAEFVGKGHRFVVSQLTRQTGRSFTDGGGDSFSANTGHNDTQGQKRSSGSLSDSRGHTWTGTRNWSAADNLSTSTSSSRVYEFLVEPQEILGMPETAFLLVDNSGHGRQVVLADANPGISLLPRVATLPERS